MPKVDVFFYSMSESSLTWTFDPPEADKCLLASGEFDVHLFPPRFQGETFEPINGCYIFSIAPSVSCILSLSRKQSFSNRLNPSSLLLVIISLRSVPFMTTNLVGF